MSLSLGIGSSFFGVFVATFFVELFSFDFGLSTFFGFSLFLATLAGFGLVSLLFSLLYFSIAMSYSAFNFSPSLVNSALSLSLMLFHFSEAIFANSDGFFEPIFFVNCSRFLFKKRKNAL